MDQYPDENEEFELQYQDELELMEDMPDENEENINFVQIPAEVITNKLNISQPTRIQELNQIDTVNSPQLSQISYGTTENDSLADKFTTGGPVNRRLFGTPTARERVSSTPFAAKQRMQPIQEVVDLTPVEELPVQAAAALNFQNEGLRSKRRLEKDLFGDIDDLYGNETYEDPIAKKARTEEERDLEDIQKILETRRRLRDAGQAIHKNDDLARLKALHDFKMRNLSYTVPQYPFLVLQCRNRERIYVRFHSEDYETNAIKNVRAIASDGSSLLGGQKQHIWSAANEIILKRTSLPETAAQTETAAVTEAVTPVASVETRLWVEKYKPRKYIDLLSDEMTNRSLLYWLKMWDKVVFAKEFKPKQETANSSELNSFNKRTGKFESNGGWRQRKKRQMLDTNVDELGRPMQKVALLCGPPGLGKTTLAHTIARHAGYAMREINASDDRSPEAFKLALENGTQMSSVLNEDKRPNCIILDEIDGAPRQSIEFLVKFVSDNVMSKVRSKGAKAQRNILKRPIICICNDVYDPALRPLRQIAFVVTFPPIDSARLAERLQQIARRERLTTDFGAVFALAEKSGNDVRSCISTMQFFNAQRKSLTLHNVLSSNLGQKDRHRGLFDVWSAIFRIQRPKKQLDVNAAADEAPQITMTDMSVSTRVRNVLDVVHSGGDYERLTQGVYENYLQQKMPDPNLKGVVEALQWFCFTDTLQRQINQQQIYAVYPYLQFGFVIWHLLFASLAWPKINFPMRGFEFNQQSVTQRNIFQAFRKGISSSAMGIGQGSVALVETVPLLKRILSPQLRSVAVQLLSQKEQYDLKHTVEIMVDLGINYTQVKSAEGTYVFQMEPDLDVLAQFSGYAGIILSYFGRQLIAREVELERIRRATPKLADKPNKSAATVKNIPNHLQRLMPKSINKNANAKQAKEVISKDFFGRIQRKTSSTASSATSSSATTIAESKTDPIVKSPIWYRYKEGFNNAVRKDIHMNELL